MLVRRCRVTVVVAGALATVCAGLLTWPAGIAGAAVARTVGATGAPAMNWGRAEALTGLAPKAGRPEVVLLTSVSCWSANNCAAGGRYSYGLPYLTPTYAFVVTERNGQWGKAERVPGATASSQVGQVSCAAAGYCVAGGYLTNRDDKRQAFVTTFKQGRWQKALVVPGAKSSSNTSVSAVSCPAARSCVVAGTEAAGIFVTSQVKGVWRPAKQLAGLNGPDLFPFLSGDSLACWAAGNCVVAGELSSRSPGVISEVNGVWHTAEEVPGTSGGEALWVGCARDGYCVVGGYDDGFNGAFVAAGRNGTFGTAIPRPGGLPGSVVAVSCPSAGSCVLAGQTWVESQTNGVWGAAEKLPGTGISEETIKSLSCGAPGSCGVGGQYAINGGRAEPFVASETNGVWTAPETVPGVLALNRHRSTRNAVYDVSCPSAGHCTAVGTDTGVHDRNNGFVTAPV
jgi:hypothetical protein